MARIEGDTPLNDVLYLSVRAHNILISAGITKIGQITAMSRLQLRTMKNCGRITSLEIERELKRCKLQLSCSFTERDIMSMRASVVRQEKQASRAAIKYRHAVKEYDAAVAKLSEMEEEILNYVRTNRY